MDGLGIEVGIDWKLTKGWLCFLHAWFFHSHICSRYLAEWHLYIEKCKEASLKLIFSPCLQNLQNIKSAEWKASKQKGNIKMSWLLQGTATVIISVFCLRGYQLFTIYWQIGYWQSWVFSFSLLVQESKTYATFRNELG